MRVWIHVLFSLLLILLISSLVLLLVVPTIITTLQHHHHYPHLPSQTKKFNRHIDIWDAVDNNSYFSAEAAAHVFSQLFNFMRTPQIESPKYTVLRKTKDYEIRQYVCDCGWCCVCVCVYACTCVECTTMQVHSKPVLGFYSLHIT